MHIQQVRTDERTSGRAAEDIVHTLRRVMTHYDKIHV
jgi:hypothetical protein